MNTSLTETLHNPQQTAVLLKNTVYPFIRTWLSNETKLVITVKQWNRTLDQNAKFHAICSDLAKQKVLFAGKPRTAEQWKVLLVSGHATATNEGAELTVGMEGEVVNLRESTALMSIKRSASLITYALAWCDMQGVVLSGERAEV